MRKIFLITLLLLAFSGSGVFSQDNIYGNYLIASLDEKVSLDLEGAQLADVLKLLSQQIGLNFISTEAVKERTLTLYMKDVLIREAMDVIFEANNLTYDYYPDSNLFVVKEMFKPALELKTKVYYLKYARVAGSKIEGHLGTILEAEGGRDDEGIKSAVEAVLAKSETEEVRGSVTEDPATNSLIVVDAPSQFSTIDEVISKLDIAPIKVMIEVEILDVDTKTIDKLGFKYTSGLYGKISPFPTSFFPNKGPIPFRTATVDLTSNELIAEFYEQDTTTKILARPKILTLNNETAEINVTTDEVIGRKIEEDNDTGNKTSEPIRISDIGDLKGSGVTLKVTPQVNPETKEITLVIEPSIVSTSNSDFKDLTTGDLYKNVEDRSTRSIVRLHDNETLFLGGLIRGDKKEVGTKVPFLGDIPLIGTLFRYKDTTGTGDRELVIFLTPHILKEEGGLAKKTKVISREQQNSSRESSMKVALDRCK